ncbi:MAG: 4-hydroxybenzoate octaprenyltransferase [Alphaproteobacteria bacterium]|nr:4-hydroxybenzoate octaprenyltransferase [Alphaproteobacteria bacterium]
METILQHMHTDINISGLISRLPQRWQAFILLARLDRPIGIWLLLLPGWWAIALASGGFQGMDSRAWLCFALFGIGAIVMRAAGCVVNDLWDRDLDRRVTRTQYRPLAAGILTLRQAVIFLGFLLMIGLVILLQFNTLTIILGLISLPLIALYPLAKRFTHWPQLVLGLVFNFGALMGWSAITATLPLPASILYAAGIFWTLGYDTIYAHQDREDDALVGIKSSALRLGSYAKPTIILFYSFFLTLILAAAILQSGTSTELGLIQIVLWLGLASHIFWHLHRWNPTDDADSLRLFKLNREWGLVILVMLLI